MEMRLDVYERALVFRAPASDHRRTPPPSGDAEAVDRNARRLAEMGEPGQQRRGDSLVQHGSLDTARSLMDEHPAAVERDECSSAAGAYPPARWSRSSRSSSIAGKKRSGKSSPQP